MRKALLIVMAIVVLLTSGCVADSKGNYPVTRIGIFKDSPAWELAKAVRWQNTKKISRIAEENPELLDYQDERYGVTLLIWAVGTERYQSAKALLENGADPDIIATSYGYTALYLASGFSWVDNMAKKDPKYVELLLEYGADPNIVYLGNEKNNITEVGTSPLMASIGCGFGKTKALVEGGADINHKSAQGKTAAITSLIYGGSEGLKTAHYLIAVKKANVVESYGSTFGSDKEFYSVDLLRGWLPKLDSEDYRMKMEIVDEFARQGVDYWATPIPERRLEQIKKLYPDSWEEYAKRY